MEGNDINEIELTEAGTKIIIRRRREREAGAMPFVIERSAVPSQPAAQQRRRAKSARAGSGAATPQPNAPEPGVAIVAPLTGVYYNAPSPTSVPFVEIGGTVQAGQVVCIIEAMKVFNELKAEVSGTVSAILPKNGQLVQKGDALIRVKSV